MPVLELTVASGDALSVRSFTVREAVSQPFEVAVVARCADPSVDLDAIVGREASFRMVAEMRGSRHVERRWRGVCHLAEQEQATPNGLSTYRFQIVPSLWLLTQRRDHRIVQHRSALENVAAVLDRWNVAWVSDVDGVAHPPLPYKVQYAESDYAFFCRILEEAGIAFTFAGGEERSLLTLSDRLHHGEPRSPALPYVQSPNERDEREFVTDVRLRDETRPGAYTIRDHDLLRPALRLAGDADKAPPPEAALEQYHYRPGAFLVETDPSGDVPVADADGAARHDADAGRRRAQRSLDSERADKKVIAFRANVVDLWPGRVFSMIDHPHPELAPTRRLLVTELVLEGEPGQEWKIAGRAAFADAPYRPPLRTARSRARVQSATVVSDTEILTDELGRARVQFAWDRNGDSTCWVRVSQGWAGAAYGMLNLPRAGQEVLIDFLEGDPEQPIIVGRVFNQMNPVVEALPANATRSAWKSDSSGGYNELLFEDKKGNELVYAQAERDARRLVKHDETSTIGHDRRKDVAANETETTSANRVQETQGNRVELTYGDGTAAVDGTRRTRVDGRTLVRVEGEEIATFAKDQHAITHGVRRERVEHDGHLRIGGSRQESVGGTDSLTVGKAFNESVGSYSVDATGPKGWIHLVAGSSIVIESDAEVTAKGSGNFVKVGGGNVTIVGSDVFINEGGGPTDLPGPGPKLPERAQVPQIDEPPPPANLNPNCCGCVLRVSIENVRAVGETPETHGGKTSFHGHAFDFKIEMNFTAGSGAGISDCTLEWWETNDQPSGWIQKNVETDMYAEFPVSDTFKPWKDRKVPCPGGGPLVVTITDFPSLATRLPTATGTRHLKFRLVVRSGGGCSCGITSATATATQILTLEKGKLVFQDFKIGPSSTTP
jgi:type VI secretion system secreted protein VgrG